MPVISPNPTCDCPPICCAFENCETEEVLAVQCTDRPSGLEIGQVVEIGDECYTYLGIVECEGDEEPVDFGDVYETCEECVCVLCQGVISNASIEIIAGTDSVECIEDMCRAVERTHNLEMNKVGSCSWFGKDEDIVVGDLCPDLYVPPCRDEVYFFSIQAVISVIPGQITSTISIVIRQRQFNCFPDIPHQFLHYTAVRTVNFNPEDAPVNCKALASGAHTIISVGPTINGACQNGLLGDEINVTYS